MVSDIPLCLASAVYIYAHARLCQLAYGWESGPTTPHMIQKAYTRGDIDRLYARLAICAIEVNVRLYLRLIRRAPDGCCSRRGHDR